jgi:hypothetical protein
MEPPILKAKSRQEVAEEYGICIKTLIKRLESAKIILEPGLIFPNMLEIIYKTFGVPNIPKNSNKLTKKEKISY